MSLVESGVSWLRQSVAWSNSGASWRERLTLVLFLGVAVGLGFWTVGLQLWQAALVWAVYFVAVSVCSRQGWLQLFGPVLFYDMIRTARQSRYLAMRLIYAAVLLFILCFTYMSVAHNRRLDTSSFFFHLAGLFGFVLLQIALLAWLRFITGARGRVMLAGVIAVLAAAFLAYAGYLAMSDEREMTPRETALLAETYFAVFMIVQLFTVALLTPAYVAGAIADEKERKTLEFMLATDLSNHEIVLSKLLSRLANLTLFLLTGLPILSILQFLGGVDTELMLAGFAATGLTMLGIASVSILFSTLLKRSRDAIGLTYLTIIAYSGVGTLGKILALNGVRFMGEPIWTDGPTLAVLADGINIGNPLTGMIEIIFAIRGATLAVRLPELLTDYAWFHGVLALVCILWSIVRLRAVALKQTVAGKTQKLPWWEPARPVIGDLPMMWKELHIEGRLKLNWLGWGIVIVLVLLTIGSGVFALTYYVWPLLFRPDFQMPNVGREINIWFRIAGTGVGLLMLLMVSVRAATCITHERERDTFDALLTTPMSAEAMLAAKLLGCLTGMRLGWLWLGAMIAIALVTGGLHPLAAPILVGAWFIYAVFHAMVGLWFSMACQSSMRASVLTVLTVLFLGGGHWLVLGMCCYFPAALVMPGRPDDFLEYVLKFHAAMTPAVVLSFFAYSWENLARDMQHNRDFFGVQMVVFSMIGLFLWAAGCVILWYGLLLPKFRDLTRREELIYR